MPSRSTRPRALLRRAVAMSIAALALCIAAPAAATAADYVAMGDSYASGTGTRSYFHAGCERSVYAYPYLIQGSFGSSFSFVACGGARTNDVLNNQVGALDASTKYATISIGGNDAGFSSVITECAKPIVSCTSDINAARSFIQNTLPGRLNSVYAEIRRRAPNAVVVVVGYPRLFNGEDCNAGTFFSSGEMTSLNQTADLLANVTRTRARAHGFSFVDPRQAFVGHAVCDDHEWLNGLSNPTSESYHPNRDGHAQGYQGIVRAAMQAAPSPNAPNGGVGRLAFNSTRSGNWDVWVANADGQFPENLTAHPSADVDPAWSPDGTKVAFASDRDGDNEIYVMDGDGSNLRKLTSNASDDRDPAWSPNGQYLAFRSNRTGDNEIFRMTATGASQTNLTNNPASDWAPDWSPDGAEIVFQRFTGGSATGQGNEIVKANADGQGQRNLTNNAAAINDGRPAWSPDGAAIAFHSNRTGNFEVFTMGAEGESVTQRTSHGAGDEDPAWSPDGQQIAFHTDRSGNDDVWTMTATGGSPANRTAVAGSDTAPSWQADSTPPRTTIDAGPDGPVADARPQFAFSSSEKGAKLECRVDGGAWAVCASPFTLPALADGEHTFSVRSTDPAGNPDPNPVVRRFVVDTTAPEIEVECPADVLLGAEATATVRATDATSGLAQIDDPSGEHPLDTSSPGRQTFSIQAIDQAGNVGTGSCAYVVRYPDPGTPQLTDGGTPNAGTFALGWTPSAPAGFPLRYELQRRDAAGDWETVAGDLADPARGFSGADRADEGTWTFRVRGVDAVNELETGWSPVSGPVKVDLTAPRAPKLGADREPEFAAGGGWFRDEVTVSTAGDGDPDLRDGSAPSGVDPASVAAPERLTETATITRTVRDRVGHESAPASLRVQVDATAPVLRLTCPESVVLGGDAVVEVAASDVGSGLATDPSGEVAVDTSEVGVQRIERTAVDNVGHETTEHCDVLVRYDYSGLEEPFADGGRTTFKAGSTIPLKFTLTDAGGEGVAGARYEVALVRGDEVVDAGEIDDDGKHGAYHFNLKTTGVAPGPWTLRITLDDGTVHRRELTLR